MKKLFPFACLALVLAAVSALAQGPLTPIGILRGRTDSNGSLMTAYAISVPPTTPLTAIANLRGRTDSAGSLLVTTTTGVGGTEILVATGRQTAQTAAIASVMSAYTVGAADGTFELKWDITVTTATSHSFQANLTITDENNVANVIPLLDSINKNGQYSTLIINTQNAGVYAGRSVTFRAKAGTTITLSTSGTFTTVTYNAEGFLFQIA